jgi:hypothetical protein
MLTPQIVSADMGITALTQENLELAPPTLMDVDAVKSTEPTLGSQICALTISTNSDDASRIQKNSLLSDKFSTTTPKVPPVETIHSAVPSVMPSDLASPKDAQTHKNNAGLSGSAHKSARPTDSHHDHDRLFDTTPGEFFFVTSDDFFSFFFPPNFFYGTAKWHRSTSKVTPFCL